MWVDPIVFLLFFVFAGIWAEWRNFKGKQDAAERVSDMLSDYYANELGKYKAEVEASKLFSPKDMFVIYSMFLEKQGVVGYDDGKVTSLDGSASVDVRKTDFKVILDHVTEVLAKKQKDVI